MSNVQKKHLLVIHHVGFIGGASQSLLDFLNCIDFEKYRVTVYTKTADSDQMLRLLQENKNLTVRSFGDYPYIFGFYSGNEKVLLNPWNLISLLRIRKCGRKLREIVALEKPDMIIFNTMCMCWAGRALKEVPAKKIIFVRETYGKEILPVRNPIMKHQIRDDFDQAVYLTDYDQQATADPHGMIISDKFRMSEVPGPGLPFQKEEGKKYILFLGGNSLIKGVETAVHSVSFLPTNMDLVIAGCNELISADNKKSWRIHKPGSDYRRLYRLDQYVSMHHLVDRIHFTGRLASVNTVIEQCDMVMIPTLIQHQSRPFIEAGLMRKAAVISDMPCMQDEARNEYNCLTFPIGNASRLAEQCCRLLNDDALRKQLIENNSQWMRSHHDFSKLPAETRQLLDHVVSNIK